MVLQSALEYFQVQVRSGEHHKRVRGLIMDGGLPTVILRPSFDTI